ncbi:hypothetical protein ACJMK2_040115, partial [Sinanodonta woodiana]
IPESLFGQIHKKVNYMRCYLQGIDGQIKQDIVLMRRTFRCEPSGRANNQPT